MDEHDLESLYELIYKVVREDLKELGKDEEYVDYFVDEIIDYILKDDKTRIKRFYNRLFGDEDYKLLMKIFK